MDIVVNIIAIMKYIFYNFRLVPGFTIKDVYGYIKYCRDNVKSEVHRILLFHFLLLFSQHPYLSFRVECIDS